LNSLDEHEREGVGGVVGFRQGLEALGWIENRNIQLEHRYAAGDVDQIQTYTTEVVRSAPDVIVCSSTPIVAALKQATDTIPIVFSLVNDPVGQGFVATLSRPGGNITGFSFIDFPLIGKWIEMLKEIAPGIKRMMLIFNPNTSPFYTVFLREFGAASASLAVELSASPVHDEAEIEAAIKTFARARLELDRGCGCIHQYSPPVGHGLGGAAWTTRHLPFSAVRRGRRADLLRT